MPTVEERLRYWRERATTAEAALQYIADGMGETQPVAIGMLAPTYAKAKLESIK